MSGISKIVATMKNLMKLFVLVAASAMALASCQKNEFETSVKDTVHFTVNAGIQTKTSIVEGNGVYTPKWDGNEELGLLFSAPGEATKAGDVVKLANTQSGDYASFEGNVTVEGTEGTFYAFYPAAAFNRGYEDGDARLDLKNVQKPTATSFDPTCDILVAKPYDYSVEDGKVVADGLEFARIMSVLRIDLKSNFADVQNEFVESISFTAGDVEITGYARIFLDNPKFDKWASNGSQWCTVTANYDTDLVSINGTSNSVYLIIAPVTIPAAKDLTFEIKTKNYNISKTVKSPEMKFIAGDVLKINLNLNTGDENTIFEKKDSSVDYSDEYLIVNTDLTKAASNWAEGNNLPAVGLNSENGVVYEADNLAACKMTITKVKEGENEGKYTIQDALGKYLYAAGGTKNNHLKGQATASYWTIEEKDGNYVITSTEANCTRNLLRYNSQNNIFSCYASGQNDVTLYKYSDIKADTTPKITVTNTSYSVLATDTSVEIPYTVKNITDAISASVADGATMSNVSANVTDGKVTVSFAANEESAEKTATIVLSYDGATSINVTITQAGKPAESGDNEEAQETLNFSDRYSANTVLKGNTVQATNFNISFAGDGTAAQYYTNGTSVRAYAKNTFTVSSDKTIVKVVITFGTSDGSNAITTDTGTYQNGTWTGSAKSVKFTVGGTSGNRRIAAITVHYIDSTSGEGGGETPDPNPTPDPEEPSTGVSKTAKITFGSNAVKISAASVTGTDSENNNWTITTVGTTSYTSNSSYYQVGSSSKPATSITFTTTLPAGASVSNVEAKFGGFSGTAGTVTLKVGDTSIGTGSLNATTDVVVNSTSTASGNVVTVTVTGISKGVKCYYITVNYTN